MGRLEGRAAAGLGPSSKSLFGTAAWLPGLLALVACSAPDTAFAWVYPEHRDIAIAAVEKLDPERRAEFDRLWREARITHEKRLCDQVADSEQSVTPACIDWAALSAISGDHSCSSQDLTAIVLQSEWILAVADVAAQLKLDLGRIDVLPSTEPVPGSKDPVVDLKRLDANRGRARRAGQRIADGR